MSESLQISAKHVGALALNNCCKRCFWIRLRLRNRLPFGVFPSIFSKIDVYTKHVVEGWFKRTGGPPPWLCDLMPLSAYVEPPTFHRFRIHDQKNDIVLTGSPDAVFRRPDNSHLIADYKTALPENDSLLEMYIIQLNVYAVIGEACGLSPVKSLALIYTSPLTDVGAAQLSQNQRGNGFAMAFSVTIKPIGFVREMIPTLLAEVRRIFELPSPPPGAQGCRDCKYLGDLLDLVEQLDRGSPESQQATLRVSASTREDSPLVGARFGGLWLPYDDEDRPGPWSNFQRQ